MSDAIAYNKTDEAEVNVAADEAQYERELANQPTSGTLNVIISGVALFSDGYNAQISMTLTLDPPIFEGVYNAQVEADRMNFYSWLHGAVPLDPVRFISLFTEDMRNPIEKT